MSAICRYEDGRCRSPQGCADMRRCLAPPSAERKLAEQDVGAYGVDYLIDGKRVHPARIVVLKPTPERTNDEQG